MKFLYFLVCFCIGCAEVPVQKKKIFEADDAEEFQKICRRIGNLNMTAVATGSAINKMSASGLRILIKKYGVNISDTVLANRDIFAGADTDDHRLNYLLDAINSNYEIIWAARGGYGTARIIAPLNYLPEPKFPKTFVGFCDATALNLFISQKWPRWRVIHATVLTFLNKTDFENKFEILLDILENKIDHYEMDGVYPLNDKALAQKSVTGKLTGGNLCTVVSSLKTCWEIQTDGKILFLEDTHEMPEHIYRAMYHLKEAGKLSKVKAVIFGHFHEAGNPERLELFLKGFAQTLDIPVYITNKFGHGIYNVPLIYNAKATINDNKMTVSVK
ncbi:MAG: LD-carboxypeptidase [Holosporaceae bacterium]|jgi:muramoyltetrapeptide carboxypeptidase|nr:LD-carboxypeptidase [Holosporaceae bacterium]